MLSLVYPFVIYGIFDHVLMLTIPRSAGPETMQIIHSTRRELLQMLVLFHVLFILLVAILSIFVSHRIAGPLFKLKRTMEEAATGHWDQKLSFRSGDYFKEIAESYNGLTQEFQKRRLRHLEAAQSSIHLFEKVSENLSGEQKQLAENAVRALRNSLE